jgi:hypothetical protein
MVTLFVTSGANINLKNKVSDNNSKVALYFNICLQNGMTSLHLACSETGEAKVVSFLLGVGAQIEACEEVRSRWRHLI